MHEMDGPPVECCQHVVVEGSRRRIVKENWCQQLPGCLTLCFKPSTKQSLPTHKHVPTHAASTWHISDMCRGVPGSLTQGIHRGSSLPFPRSAFSVRLVSSSKLPPWMPLTTSPAHTSTPCTGRQQAGRRDSQAQQTRHQAHYCQQLRCTCAMPGVGVTLCPHNVPIESPKSA